MLSAWARLRRDNRGAVASTVALSLFALIGAAGLAFDYAHMAALDTELQQAADQAALAGASQLDGQNGAIQRATAAAKSLLANKTLLANDSDNDARAVTIPVVVFYVTKPNAEDDVNGFTDVARFAEAKFVRVAVKARRANYALTPVVGAFTSGDLNAEAVAGLGSAICKVPPVMMCNPAEATDPGFNVATFQTKGIKLIAGGSGSYSAGNFGFLNHAGGSSGNTGLREDLGWAPPPGDCQPGTGVDTKPGVGDVDAAINTRFDIYDGNSSCISPGFCPPSINSVKDVVRAGNANGNNACKLHSAGWHEVSSSGTYLPSSATVPLSASTTPVAMGHPRDMCHAVSSAGSAPCSGVNLRIGDGIWDRDAYFRANYLRTSAGSSGQAVGTRWTATEWQTNTGLSPSVARSAANFASRYNVYKWEIANRNSRIDGVTVLGSRITSSGSGASADRSEGQPVCSPLQSPSYGSGIVPSSSVADRRRFTMAVANCATADHGGVVNGSSIGVTVTKWIDVFLVEPSLNRSSGRTGQKDVYIEVIGESLAGGNGSTAAQFIRHDSPYLVK